MTDIDSPVTRRTQHKIHDRFIIATLTPGGVHVRLERTQQGGSVDYVTLYKWIEQSQVSIKARKGK